MTHQSAGGSGPKVKGCIRVVFDASMESSQGEGENPGEGKCTRARRRRRSRKHEEQRRGIFETGQSRYRLVSAGPVGN